MPPKSATTLRRVSSLSKVLTPPTSTPTSGPASARPTKSSKPSKIIRLSLPKDFLSGLPHEETVAKTSKAKAKASPLSQSTTVASDEPITSTIVKSELDATPTIKEEATQASPAVGIKVESSSDRKPGDKREYGAGVEGDDKEKPKTNPRKRPRPDPSKPDGRTAAAKAMKGALGAAGVTTHKLGPKANQGAINAGLRALDRTSKPCRKWEKTGFRVKSFTGRVWEIPSWRAPTTRAFGSESDSGSSNTQSKENSSSNIGSDKSPAVNPSIMASSPAPGPAVTA
ncbi:hypothetical protein ABVK25_003986 [Lepraria finkii]|uniref:Uncharacterized protein n=1 Tax=Lepraria finkii TaxID=1340010 RepID=A0ABR4BEB4_9LECA